MTSSEILVPIKSFIERDVTINSETLLKDICSQLMVNNGLGNLIYISKVSIKIADNKVHIFDSFIPNLNITIGSLIPIFGDVSVVTILIPGKVEEFSMNELIKNFYSNFLELLVKRYPAIKNMVAIPKHKFIIENIENDFFSSFSNQKIIELNNHISDELQFIENEKKKKTFFRDLLNFKYPNNSTTNFERPSFSQLKREVEKSQEPEISEIELIEEIPNLSPQEPSSIENTDTTSNVNFDKSIIDIFRNLPPLKYENNYEYPNRFLTNSRLRISFDQNTETPLLEKWFTMINKPSQLQMEKYAEVLNERSKRTGSTRITAKNIKIWFKNKRSKCKIKRSFSPV